MISDYYKEFLLCSFGPKYGTIIYHLKESDLEGAKRKLVDLAYTDMEDKEFKMLRIDNSDDDWIICHVRKKQFKGSGDPTKLEEIIKVFKEWVESC